MTNPSESSAGQANHLPGRVSTAVTLLNEDSASRAIEQKDTVQNLHGKVPTAVTNRSEGFAS